MTSTRTRALVVGLLPAAAPVRSLAIATFVNSVGNGLFATTSAVFLVRVVGLTVVEVGTGLAIGGCVALLVGMPLGHLADRFGAKRVFVVLTVVQGTAVALYATLGTWTQFLVVAALTISADRGTAGVRNAFIAAVTDRADLVRTRAYLRSVVSAGTAIGAMAGGAVLVRDSRPMFLALLAVDTVTFLVTAVVVARIPSPPRPSGRELDETAGTLVTNWRFLLTSGCQAVLSLHAAVLTIAMPLWITTRTGLPHVTIAIVLSASTAGAVLFQVRVSRQVETTERAATAARRAGLYLAAACLTLSFSGGSVQWIVIVLLTAGTALRLSGELLQAASGWYMSFAAAPPARMGVYQSAYSTAFSLTTIVGPLACAAVVSAPGPTGWLALAAVFAATGITAAAVAPQPSPWAGLTRQAGHTPPLGPDLAHPTTGRARRSERR